MESLLLLFFKVFKGKFQHFSFADLKIKMFRSSLTEFFCNFFNPCRTKTANSKKKNKILTIQFEIFSRTFFAAIDGRILGCVRCN